MRCTTRLVLIALTAFLVAPAATALAAPRMPIGFFDDPSFRWSPQRGANLAGAAAAGASLIHTTADWSQIAPKKPASASDADDPAYRLNDLDELVGTASRYGLQVMITISGTPKWANGNQKSNVPPKKLGDLTTFARLLASRYDGTNGHGAVARWGVWNEPNLQQFLTPQYRGKRIVSPSIYARLYKAAYAGIKAGNPLAQVAIGNTSARGRDKPLVGNSATVAPGTFARLLARTKGLKFNAYAHHPYPTAINSPAMQKVRWPNVTLTQMSRFEKGLDSWFHRKNIPVWITEYGHQTKPPLSKGVSYSKQSAYAKQALLFAAKDVRVELFTWFIYKDSPASSWKSGLYTAGGSAKPALNSFSATARLIDGTTQSVAAGRQPLVKVFVPRLTYDNAPGTTLGINYKVYDGTKLIGLGQPAPSLAADQSVSFSANFTPAKGKQYRVTADVGDVHGNHELRTVLLKTS